MTRHRKSLRRRGVLVLVVLGVSLLGSTVPATGAGAGDSSFGEPTTLCTVTDERLPEISGAAETAAGLFVANDKGAILYRLDSGCEVAEVVPFEDIEGIDTEEVTLGPDGTVWLVDSGGNVQPRRSVALYGRTVDGDVRVVRFRYPDSTRRDAEAAMITLDNEFVLFTKDRGQSEVFKARMPGRTDDPVTLERQGVLDVEAIAGRPGAEGSLLLTGAALSPDGLHVALRTYTDILEWRVQGGDVVGSVLNTTPTPVAKVSQQRQGEAITYSVDADSILALSEQLPSPVLNVRIDRATAAADGTGNAVTSVDDGRPPMWALLSVTIPALLLIVGALTALIMRSSQRRS